MIVTVKKIYKIISRKHWKYSYDYNQTFKMNQILGVNIP